jgi:hypothetical protein
MTETLDYLMCQEEAGDSAIDLEQRIGMVTDSVRSYVEDAIEERGPLLFSPGQVNVIVSIVAHAMVRQHDFERRHRQMLGSELSAEYDRRPA